MRQKDRAWRKDQDPLGATMQCRKRTEGFVLGRLGTQLSKGANPIARGDSKRGVKEIHYWENIGGWGSRVFARVSGIRETHGKRAGGDCAGFHEGYRKIKGLVDGREGCFQVNYPNPLHEKQRIDAL